jgi:hypothetical protein
MIAFRWKILTEHQGLSAVEAAKYLMLYGITSLRKYARFLIKTTCPNDLSQNEHLRTFRHIDNLRYCILRTLNLLLPNFTQ